MTTEHLGARPILASTLVTAVDHVGIAVPDLDAAITWYHDHLGMILVHEEINTDQRIREAMMVVPGGGDSCAQLQLMAPLDDESTIAKFLDKRGPGIQQIGRLQGAGFTVVITRTGTGQRGCTVAEAAAPASAESSPNTINVTLNCPV